MIFQKNTQSRIPTTFFLKFVSICFLSVFVLVFAKYVSGMMLDKDRNGVNKPTSGIFKIIIVRNKAQLNLYRDKKLTRSYLVAVGNDGMGKATPAGRYRIVNKVKDPIMVWRSGKVIPPNDPRNSYGARWIGLADYTTGKYRGCGIQGTNVESSIGKHITIGCVRMYNMDIIELFDLVDLGTEVVVQ